MPPTQCPHLKPLLSGELDGGLACGDTCSVNGVPDELRLIAPPDPRDEEEHKVLSPWIPLLKDLILEAELPARLAQHRLQLYLPHYIDPGPITVTRQQPQSSGPSTFYPFVRLPPELRRQIWLLAADQPRRLLEWEALGYRTMADRGGGLHAVNASKHVPRIAQACSEAWSVLTQNGCYIPSNNELCKTRYWCAADDVVYICCRDLVWLDIRHVEKVRSVAVDLDCFLTDFDLMSPFLHKLPALRSLFIVVATPEVTIGGDIHTPGCCGSVFDEAPHLYDSHLHTLISLDKDRDRLEMLDRHWALHMDTDSNRNYGQVSKGGHFGVGASIASSSDGGMGISCLQCHMDDWESYWLDKVRTTWLKHKASEALLADPDMFSEAGGYNTQNEWVREAEAMPRIRPAVWFTLKANYSRPPGRVF